MAEWRVKLYEVVPKNDSTSYPTEKVVVDAALSEKQAMEILSAIGTAISCVPAQIPTLPKRDR